MTNELDKKDVSLSIRLSNCDSLSTEIKQQLAPMLQNISQNLPEIRRATQNFAKRQSQYMDNILTVAHPTPLRNLRQITAEVEKAYSALRESHFSLEKKKIEVRMKQRDMELEQDELKRELLLLEAQEAQAQIIESERYLSGAIRKIRNYTEQYNSITAKLMQEQNITEFSEIDFERDEERYHIMTVFSQALTAARTRGGVIDEGNHIYLMQLGINGMMAQALVTQFLNTEAAMIEKGLEPPHSLVLKFLNDMAKKFQGCSTTYAEYKGMSTFVEAAAVQPKLLGEGNE